MPDIAFTITDAYRCAKPELTAFLHDCGFRSAPLDDYADKVLRAAHFTALHHNGSLCGLCITYMNRPQRDMAYITYIALRPQCRHIGGGKLLLHSALATAQVRGFATMRLEVRKDNTAALRLYHSAGFAITEKTDNTYYMTLPLQPPSL